ncbi:YibE/F family protein [Patescibacteria group bacterium]|nr:YibE/F family protein [Patescibacteria group bacterium]
MKGRISRLFFFFFTASLFFVSFSASKIFSEETNQTTSPKEEIMEARITDIVSEEEIELMGETGLSQKLELLITKGSLAERKIIIETGAAGIFSAGNPRYFVGDKLLISYFKGIDEEENFFIVDYSRKSSLLFLFLIFVILAVLVGGLWGATSLLGMGFSFLIIFKFILPKIIQGYNPVLIAITGSLLIVPVTFYLSHGFNKKTHLSISSTAATLVLTGLLSSFFVGSAKLTGFSTEEAGFLQAVTSGKIDMAALLLGGIIISVLGVLDDITVAQTSVAFQLKEVSPEISFKELYCRSMKVGRDHISSMINTLVLVYAGTSLPLLLLFIDSSRSFSEAINYELVANEIVRTLVGSIGLVLAVPITTLLASFFLTRGKKD